MMLVPQLLLAQNINRPNKTGPMGMEVNTATGNVFLSRTDVYIPARQLNLDFTFAYSSVNHTLNTGYGNGWILSYNTYYRKDSAGRVIIIWGDGREDIYTPAGNGLKAPVGIFDSLSQYQTDQYLLRQNDGLTYYFDNAVHRRLTKMTEPNGNFLNFSYADSLLTAVSNAAGQAVTLAYAGGRLSSITDANASPVQTYAYTYDGYGNLTKVTDPTGGAVKYTYLVNGPLSSVTDKNGNVADVVYYPGYAARELISCNSRTGFSYDTTTHTTTVIDFMDGGQNQTTSYVYNDKGWLTNLVGSCCGYKMAFRYDNSGNLIERKDANGNLYRYTYDNRGNYLTVTDPLGNVTTLSYTPDFNQVTGITDAEGKVYSIAYDAAGNATRLARPDGSQQTMTYAANGDLLTATDPTNNRTTYVRDSYGYLQKVTLPTNAELQTSFDARGNLRSGRDPDGNDYSFLYDSLNRLKQVTDALNRTAKMRYDKAGNLLSFTDAKGFTQRYSYDASNRIVSYKEANGATSSFAYDAMNNVVKTSDASGQTTLFTYDNQNRLAGITDALGNGYAFAYDGAGNVVSATRPGGNTMTYTYDALNRMVGGADAVGSLGQITYNKNGKIASYTDATGGTFAFGYDHLNRLIKVSDPLGHARFFSYDNNGNLLTKKDRNNNVSSYSYNALNRTVSFTDNNGNTVSAEYDLSGHVKKVTDQNGNSTSYQYDAAGRLFKQIYPDGSYQQLTYDDNNNVIATRLADGSLLTYAYDSVNRLLAKDLPDGSHFTYSYDAAGRLVSATNTAGSVTYAYDAIGRVMTESFGARKISYVYNLTSRVSTVIYPDGTRVTKTYDQRWRLTGVTMNDQLLASYRYNGVNRLLQKAYANGVATNYRYDALNRLAALSANDAALPSLDFQYDNEGNKLLVLRGNDAGYGETFSYDAGYRLTGYRQGVVSGGGIPSPLVQNSYVYDGVGNRTSAVLNGVSTGYTRNNLNQHTTAGGISFTYDGRGNKTFDGRFYSRYDAQGRKLVDSSAAGVFRYQYDALGRRIAKTSNGQPVYYSYAGLQPVEERNDADSVLGTQVFERAFQPLARRAGSRNYFYHLNDLNSTEAVTDSTGAIAERYRYEDFGKTFLYNAQGAGIASSGINNRFLFTGQEFDDHNKSHAFHFRNYDPATGTFSQRDPVGYKDQMGLYQYVGNNPGNRIDPLGLQPTDDPTVVYVDEQEWDQEVNKMREWLYQNRWDNFYNQAVSNADSKYHNEYESFYRKRENCREGSFYYKFRGRLYTSTELNYYFEGVLFKMAGKSRSDLSGLVNQWRGSYEFNHGHNWRSGLPNNWIENATILANVGGDDKMNEMANLGYDETSAGLESYIVNGSKQDVYKSSDFTNYKDPGNLPALPAKDNYGEYKRVVDFNTHDVRLQYFLHDLPSRKEFRDKMLEHERIMNLQVGYTKPDCPQNNKPNGPQKPPPSPPGQPGKGEVVFEHDPNEIIGPDGTGDKKWVSVADRLPYTVLFENAKEATAPAKVAKIYYPIDAKQDINTFQLGSFGFNNLTFDVPANTNAYYQRLDARDSLNLYVDVTAGIDAVSKQAFWIFESIDPVTLLPTADPLKGFLLTADSSSATSGHGFVNFSIKPLITASTRDTISVYADIVFGTNDTIPTNRYKNTVDALPPASNLAALPAVTPDTEIPLHLSGSDDAGGSGLKGYAVYVSDNGGAPQLYVDNFSRTDTAFRGVAKHTYQFYIAATDSVGNKEAIQPAGTVRITDGEEVICPGGNIAFSAANGGTAYQWQVNDGSGYANLVEGGIYSGATTATLTLTGAPSSLYGYRYRAVVNGTPSATEYLLKFEMTWEGTVSTAWENPANWSCGSLPDAATDVKILSERPRYPQVNGSTAVRSLTTATGAFVTVRPSAVLTIVK